MRPWEYVTGLSQREWPTANPLMFEPIRGGTRGGQAEFKWADVSADKDREVRIFLDTLSSN